MHGLPRAPSSRGNLSTSGSVGSPPIIHPDGEQCVQRPRVSFRVAKLADLARPAPRLRPCRAQSRRLYPGMPVSVPVSFASVRQYPATTVRLRFSWSARSRPWPDVGQQTWKACWALPRVRISNPQLTVTQVRAPPRVMLAGCPKQRSGPGYAEYVPKGTTGTARCSVVAAQRPIRRGLPGWLQDGCSAC